MSKLTYYARKKITLKSQDLEFIAASGNPVTINGDAIITTSTLPPSSLGIGPVGSSPNGNAGVISGGILNLEPADATHPGVILPSPQSLGGAKNFLGDVAVPNLTLSLDTSKIAQNGHSLYRAGDDLSKDNLYFGKDAGPLVPNVNARRNTCLGSQAGAGITEAQECVMTGNFAGNLHQDGGQSTFVGYSAGSNSLDCETCTFVGHQAASNVEHGSNLIAIGKDAGTNFAGFDADSIAIGHEGGGSNSIWLGQAGMTACRIAGIYGQTIQGGGLPVSIDVDNRLGTTVSSLKYKRKIEDVDGRKILGLRAKRFCMKEDPTERICYGFIAEETKKIFPECIVYEEEDPEDPKGIQYDKLWPLLQDVVRQQEERIQVLEKIIKS